MSVKLTSENEFKIFQRFHLMIFKSKSCHVCPILERELPSINVGPLSIGMIDVDENDELATNFDGLLFLKINSF